MATPSRSLADDIRGRSDAELIDLVLARPDLARPAPADLTSLAARAGPGPASSAPSRRSTGATCRCSRPSSSRATPPSAAVLLHLLGTDEPARSTRSSGPLALGAGLARRRRRPRGAHRARGARHPIAGLGAPMRELRPSSPPEDADPERIRATLAEAPDDSRAMLERMTWGPAFGVLPAARPGRTTARWLLEHHLLVPVSTDRVALPREVGLVLREGRLHRRPS